MTWVVAALFLLSLANYLIKRLFRFKSDFWVLVRKYPNLAQTWFETSDCWRIFYSEPPGGYARIVPENEWAGPFNIAARVKNTGEHTRAVVFGRHGDLALSQAAFPHAINLAIGHYPKPKTNALNLVFVVVTGAWLGAVLLGASDLDRWVIRDGTVACKSEEETRSIQRASSPSSRRTRIENAVEERVCSVLLANERVRISELSADGTRVLAHTQKDALQRWMIANELRKTNPGWIAMPWRPSASPNKDVPASVQPAVSLLLNADGTCSDWAHAIRNSYVDECQNRKRLRKSPRELAIQEDPTPLLGPEGHCRDWGHALRHKYMDTCFAARKALSKVRVE